MKRELEEEKYTVDLVNDGVEAVLRFIDKTYDFVLLDIAMPRLSGINAMRIIKRLKPDIPALIFSGNAGYSEIKDSLEAGAIGCFTKPFKIEELKDCIRKSVIV